MRTIEIYIPKAELEEFYAKHDDQKTAMNYLSVSLENRIRTNRKLLARDLENNPQHVMVSIPIRDFMLPYINEYCIIKGISKQELIVKIMKGTRL
jgi:hypothetical protein